MTVIRFLGSLIPRTFKVTSLGHPTVHWRFKDLQADIDFEISDNELVLSCETNAATKEDIGRLLAEAALVADGFVSLLCFKTGFGITYVIDKCKMPDGTIEDVQWLTPAVENLAASLATNEGMGASLNLLLRDKELLLAVRDLADTIKSNYSAATNLARAVESIRHHFDPEGTANNRKPGWEAMQKALNVSPDCLRAIVEASRLSRHGKRINEDIHTEENGIRAWKVVDRFLQYRLRNDQPLPAADFPLLK